jgi:hypothetical protein
MNILISTFDLSGRILTLFPCSYPWTPAVNGKKSQFSFLRPGYGIITPLSATHAAGMAKDAPIQFKGTSLKIIQTQLRTTDPATLHAALGELTGNSPDFFENELARSRFQQC